MGANLNRGLDSVSSQAVARSQGGAGGRSPAVRTTLEFLRVFLRGVLRFGFSRPEWSGSPSFVSVTPTDGNEHPVDRNANYLVKTLNFRNRTGNTGTLYVGTTGQTDSLGIALTAGQGVSPEFTNPSLWFYKVVGGVAGDRYEIWWSG